MTLFEAIRALKPGQNIVTGEGTARWPYNEHIRWELGAPQPSFTFPCYNLKEEDDFRIIDLPAPKLTLPEAAKAICDGSGGCMCCAFKGEDVNCLSHQCTEGHILYALQAAAKLDIDWEAK